MYNARQYGRDLRTNYIWHHKLGLFNPWFFLALNNNIFMLSFFPFSHLFHYIYIEWVK